MLVLKRETIPKLNFVIPGEAYNILENYHNPNIHGALDKNYKLKKNKEHKVTLPGFNISHTKKDDHISIPRFDLDKPERAQANTKFFKDLYGFIDIERKPALNPVYFEKDLKGRKPVDVLLANLSAQAEAKDNDEEPANDGPIASTKDIFMKSFRERFIGKKKQTPLPKEKPEEKHETPRSQRNEAPKNPINITPIVLGDEQISDISTDSPRHNEPTGVEPTNPESDKTRRTNRKTANIVSELLESEGFEVSSRVTKQIDEFSKLTKENLSKLLRQQKSEFKKSDSKPVLIKRLIKKASNIAQRIEKGKNG